MNKSDLIKLLNINIDTSESVNDFVHFYDEILTDETLEYYLEKDSKNVLENIFKEAYELEKYNVIFDIINPKMYLNNQYNLNIKPKEFHSKKYDLEYTYYEPYQPFLYDSITIDKNGEEHIKVGYFDKQNDYKFLSLSKDSKIWMEITPHEINTMQKSIDEASGNVVVMGLGLGYYSYMISNKDNVNKITIIESDKEVIEIFNKFIFPFFNHKEKITIIETDALTYDLPNDTNYCFIDIYRDEVDGLPIYLKLKEKELNTIKYSYWIEESFKMMILRYLYAIYADLEINDNNYNKIKSIYKNKNILDEIKKIREEL